MVFFTAFIEAMRDKQYLYDDLLEDNVKARYIKLIPERIQSSGNISVHSG